MPTGTPLVSLDCTGPTAVAVLRHRDGHREQLLFDGAAHLPCGVYQGEGRFLTGRDALDAATTAPDRFIALPLRLLEAAPNPSAGDGDRDPSQVVAALLERIRTQADQAAGEPVHAAVAVVPPGWGPQRRTRLRVAAHHAGVTDIELVDAATALTHRHTTRTAPDGSSATVLVCRILDSTTDVTIARANATTYDEIASLTSAAENGLDGQAVTARAVALTAQALTAADLTAGDLTTTLLLVPTGCLPALAGGLRELGVSAPIRVCTDTDTVHGALDLIDPAERQPPRWHRAHHALAVALPLPGAFALTYFLLQTGVYRADISALSGYPPPPYLYTLWPAWSMVAVFVFAGSVALVLANADRRTPTERAESDQRRQLARGIRASGAATLAAGLIATMLGTISYQLVPTWYFLLWAAVPAFILAAIAALVAALIHKGHTPELRWRFWLRLPNTTTVLALAGLLTIHAYLYTNLVPSWYLHHLRLPTGIDQLGTIATALAILPLILYRLDHQILLSPIVIGAIIWTHNYANTALVIGTLLAATALWWITRIRPATARDNPGQFGSGAGRELEQTRS